MIDPHPSLAERARQALEPLLDAELDQNARLAVCRSFLETEEASILERHRGGAGGLETAGARAALMDTVIAAVFRSTAQARGKEQDAGPPNAALVATGGFGRGLLSPRSDIDLLFLMPRASTKLPRKLQALVQDVLYLLWDMGFKVGHACRSAQECIEEALADQVNMTSLMDARLIAGDEGLFRKFTAAFQRGCVNHRHEEFFELRVNDNRRRHERYSHTVFLQEPNVKEGCGGMRDYQSIEWVARVKTGDGRLRGLVAKKILTAAACREMEEAYDFIHRVRNELHYTTGKATDQLTLHLQGVVATAFRYPQRDILRGTEAFMRDYYRHTRHIFRHSTSLMEAFELERRERAESGIRSFLTFRLRKREEFDGFVARDGRLFPARQDIFSEDPHRLIGLFRHCQQRNLELSPQLRRLIAQHWDDIDRGFRASRANREVFESILERKGEAARILRLMHRIGFLGRYLPEFGALDCLVQHEFFHRYTADEHTLRCLDQLDRLVAEDDSAHAVYRRLFRGIADPVALYLAVILHDTGRAENMREHIDGSAMLAAKVCNRLQIRGARRSLVMFLVDNHLAFWRTATTRNLDDPEVVAGFAAIVKSTANLDALLLFTYIDSCGTSPDGWNGWKESLMLQLHKATRRFLEEGRAGYERSLDAERQTLRDQALALAKPDEASAVADHFDRLPASAFHFREAHQVLAQVRAVAGFLERERQSVANAFEIRWIDHPGKGYTEVSVATRDRPLLLEKLCCALASEQINVLSADLYTRNDGIVMNVFRVCTTNFGAVDQASARKRFLDTFGKILPAESYEPGKFLKRRDHFLRPRTDTGIPVPVRAQVSNDLHPTCTTVEIQALDRIGLLHDLFHTVNRHGLDTAHARISTEKGVAMDTLYITTRDGGKVDDPETLASLEEHLTLLVGRQETHDRS